jgi:hypothetical protein
MAWTVQLRTEQGAILDQLIVARLPVDRVPAREDASSAVLRFIDPFGDTILNPAQAHALVGELLAAPTPDAVARDQLIAIAERCAADVHQYLRFVGD